MIYFEARIRVAFSSLLGRSSSTSLDAIRLFLSPAKVLLTFEEKNGRELTLMFIWSGPMARSWLFVSKGTELLENNFPLNILESFLFILEIFSSFEFCTLHLCFYFYLLNAF